MSTVLSDARAVLAQADKTAAVTVASPERTANVILEHRQLRTALREVLEFHAGFEQEHQTLVRMVFALVGTVTASSNGQLKWATEIPPGTAPAFRRALNELSKYLRDSSR